MDFANEPTCLSLALVFAQEPEGPVSLGWVPEKLIRIVGFERKGKKRWDDYFRMGIWNCEIHSAGAHYIHTQILDSGLVSDGVGA